MNRPDPEARVLIVDDDESLSTVLEALLQQAGISTGCVASAEHALDALNRELFAAVLTDLRMPGMGGMALLKQVTKRFPGVPVVVLTAHGSIQLAVQAMREGALDFIVKPFEREEIVFVMRKALTVSKGLEQGADAADDSLVFESELMRDVDALVTRAATSKSTVLVRGETGTGKEVVARALHSKSSRSQGPFIKVHCAALPDALLEAELFGHEKGAFTGAAAQRPGRIELAEGGTLFLDEIGDVTPAVQVKLLRMLQDREYERLGSGQTRRADVRFVAATHRELEAMVSREQFREDLFYRLNVITIWLPPLRMRKKDVVRLVDHFLAKHSTTPKGGTLTSGAMRLIQEQSWPGNVRQLENFVERLVALSDGPDLDEHDVSRELARPANPFADESVASPAADRPLPSMEAQRRGAEKNALEAALSGASGNRTAAARILGISRRTLYKKLNEYGLG